MEYTKDLVFQVKYDEVNNTLNLNRTKRTSQLIQKIKRHKVVVASILIVGLLTIFDYVLVSQFIQILSMT